MKRTAVSFCCVLVAIVTSLACFAADGASAKIFQVTSGFSDIYFYVSTGEGSEALNVSGATITLHDADKQQSSTTADRITIDVAPSDISKISASGAPQSYMFLVDAYNDNPSYRDGFSSFIRDFMDQAGDGVMFSLVTIVANNKIEELQPFTGDKEEIISAVESLKIVPGGTSLYSGLMNAIELYNKNNRDTMEIANIIVISDGVETADSNSVSRSDLEKAISAFKKGRDPKAVFTIHTIQYKEHARAKDFEDFAEISHGTFYSMSEGGIAAKLLSYINDSYILRIGRADLQSNGWDPSMLNLEAEIAIYDKEGAADPTCTTSPFKFVLPPADNSQAAGVREGAPGADNIGDIPGAREADSGFPIIPVVIGAVAAVMVAAAIILVKSGKLGTGKKTGGVFVKAEFVSGSNAGSTLEIVVRDEVIIGRDAQKCSLVVADSGVSSANSKLFLQDGAVYIEDLNSLNGTAINDMVIHAPNRLRSGDVITVGASSFVLRF